MGIVEILLVVVVVVLLFGARKLPEIGKGLGQGIKEFRQTASKDEDVTVTALKPDSARPELVRPELVKPEDRR